jgi:hypothetical protein
MTPFLITLFTPMKARVSIVWLCLVFRISVEIEWPKTARDSVPSQDGGSMIQFYVGKLISTLI